MSNEHRGIARALSVLTALNRANGSNVTSISRATGISRPALYRILGELVEAGFLRRRADDRTYFVTSKVRTLSDGFRSEASIYEIAAPVLDELQREVVWPTDLAIFRHNRLELLETTRRQSPFVIDDLLAGGELSSIFMTALGLAYLSFALPSEREAIISSSASDPDSRDAHYAGDPGLLEERIRRVRDDGYAWRYGGSVKETGTIAVPILRDGYAIASIGITFIASALSVEQAVKRHLPALRVSSLRIERALANPTMKVL